MDATGIGNNPGLAKLFAHLGKQMQEDGVIGKASGASGMLSPGEARQQISAHQGDPNFMKAYRDKSAPGHAEAVAKMQGFYAQAYPEG